MSDSNNRFINRSLKSITSVNQLSREQILFLLDLAIQMLRHQLKDEMHDLFADYQDAGKIPPTAVAMMLQKSTGTRVSFIRAFQRLGFNLNNVEDMGVLSSGKGEPIVDTVARFFLQADTRAFAIRGPWEGLTKALAYHYDQNFPPHVMMGNNISFFNAGEGEAFHTTQVLLDLLGWVNVKLFGKAISKDSKNRMSHPCFLKAISKFLSQDEEKRIRQIAEAIDGLKICFGGDLNSRVLRDWLSLAREDGAGKKFDISFILSAPTFAQPNAKYLVGVNHTVVDSFCPDFDVDVLYRLRWRLEDRAAEFHGLIDQLDKEYLVDDEFMKVLEEKGGVFFEALPIDKNRPSVTRGALHCSANMCWLTAMGSLSMRMACVKASCDCWSNEKKLAESVWKVPAPQLSKLNLVKGPSPLSEYITRWKASARWDSDQVRVTDGLLFNNLPAGYSNLILRILRGQGFDGEILSKDSVTRRDPNRPPKDMMWLPGQRMKSFLEDYPQALTAVDFLTDWALRAVEIDPDANTLSTWECDPVGTVVGIFPCPRQKNKFGLPPECILGHPAEVEAQSITHLRQHSAECDYCGGLHDRIEMRNALSASLPGH